MNILVTGGNSGLGKACVELFLKEGHKVFFTYLPVDSCIKEVEELLEEYRSLTAIPLNFCENESVDSFCDKAKELNIDILVNSAYAGKAQGNHFLKTPADDFLISFQNNVIPTIKITQACLEGMKKRRFGKIINIITSYVMDVPPTGFSVYVSTKAYLRQISKSICKEMGRFNITCNCLLPEYMNTRFGAAESFQIEQMTAAHPLKQLLKPEEVAQIVVHIANSSQQLNGVEIPINAAQHIM